MAAPSEWPEMQHELRVHGRNLRATKAVVTILAELVPHDAPLRTGSKKVHLIRHGQGAHNVAQAEWLAAGRPGEPYWVSTDPEFAYIDAELTPLGEQQARDLRASTVKLLPELLIVSPMRRAVSTGLIAFDDHVNGRLPGVSTRLPVVALEACHEHAGRHTCDKRLPTLDLAARYPEVDFSLLEHAEDPFWGDGETRESLASLARRAAEVVAFVISRSERHIVIAAHSTLLAAVVNAALVVADNSPELKGAAPEMETPTDATSWFRTGEMRTFLLKSLTE
jgi:broad specificity phosphatase PhoE